MAQDMAFGARAARALLATPPPPPPPSLRSSRLAGMGGNWAAQWHLARAVGKRFRGCRANRLYVYSGRIWVSAGDAFWFRGGLELLKGRSSVVVSIVLLFLQGKKKRGGSPEAQDKGIGQVGDVGE